MCLQLLLSKALSCHVQNFTIVSDIHEIYSIWSSFVSVVNHCLFSTVCGGGVCGYALFRHGGGWIHGEWRLGKFVTTLWYDCIFHRQKHTKFVRDMISAGLFPLTADEESLHRTVEDQRKSGSSSGNLREEQMRLKEKTPMITQTLLDAQRAAMSKDGTQ